MVGNKIKRPPEPVRRGALTKKEAWYVECLVTWIAGRGYSPTMYEMGAWLGKSRTAVYNALAMAELKGSVYRNQHGKFFPVETKPVETKP
jgi:hypothetical protein